MASTIKLKDTVEWAKRFSFGRQSALGNSLEPAITSANCIMQSILGAPFEWRWNRKEYQWTCLDPTVQWQPSTIYAVGFRLKDSNGNMQTVKSVAALSEHKSGTVEPVWSTDQANGGTTTDGDLVWTVSDIQTYEMSMPDLAWIEHAAVYDTELKKWIELENKNSLARDSALARPRFVSAHTDDGAGNIGIVFMPVPNQPYPVEVHVQKKAPLFTSLEQTWSPIPDEYSYIYNWGFLAMIWLFADDARWQVANSKFVAHLLGANEGLTETEKNIFLNNWSSLTGVQQNTATQGIQARGNQ